MAGRKHQIARAGEGSRCNCTALRKASRRMSQLCDTALAPKQPEDDTARDPGADQPLGADDGGCARRGLVMDSGALAHTLKPLERDRLVAIEIDPDDHRNRLITLTPAGRAKLAQTDALPPRRFPHPRRGSRRIKLVE